MKNIRDIAKLAGVSHSTVSRVINGIGSVKPKTREKIERIMAEQGYKPNVYARGMLGSLDKTLGVVIPDVMDPFFSSMLSGIEDVCQAGSAKLLVAESGLTADGELDAVNLMLGRGCDALIVQSKLASDEQLAEIMTKNDTLLLINRHLEGFTERCFYLDNYMGGYLAVQMLLEKGCHSIAMISRDFSMDDARQRYLGNVDALKEAGLEVDRRTFIQEAATLQGGAIAGRKLLTTGIPFDGVVCYNDAMALGLMQVMADNGIVAPRDIRVVGFDDIEVSSFSVPRLSTIHYPIREMAESAARLALQLDRDVDVISRWEPKMIPRESH